MKTLAYYHADGNEEDPLVKYEFEEIKAAIELDRQVATTIGWKDLFATAGNRRRMRIIIALAFFSQWSGNGLVSYYLNKVFITIGIENPTTQLLINGILQIWNLFWALLASSLVDKIGRRVLFMTSVVGMIIFFTLQTACSAVYAHTGHKSAAHAVIAFIFLFYASYDIAFTPLIVSYTVEILPYQIRAKGFTVFNFSISLSLIFNQYVNPVALGSSGFPRVPYIPCSCANIYFQMPSHGNITSFMSSGCASKLSSFGSVRIRRMSPSFLLANPPLLSSTVVIETKNRTLEETAALFDGDEAAEQIQAAAHAGELQNENVDEKSSGSYHEQALKA